MASTPNSYSIFCLRSPNRPNDDYVQKYWINRTIIGPKSLAKESYIFEIHCHFWVEPSILGQNFKLNLDFEDARIFYQPNLYVPQMSLISFSLWRGDLIVNRSCLSVGLSVCWSVYISVCPNLTNFSKRGFRE